MADSARTHLSNITESLNEAEQALSRTNMNLDDFRRLISLVGRRADGDVEISPAEFQQAVRNLDADWA